MPLKPSLEEDTFNLVGELMKTFARLDDGHPLVWRRLGNTALDLLEAVAVLTPAPTVDRIDDAVAVVRVLSVQLELLRGLNLVGDDDYLDFTRQLEVVGAGLHRFRDDVGL